MLVVGPFANYSGKPLKMDPKLYKDLGRSVILP